MTRKFLIAAVMAMLAGWQGAALAQDSLTIEPVADGLYVIYGSGGNVGVRVTDEGVILSDDKHPQNFEEIQSHVATVSDLPVRYVVNTHHHGDHAGGNVGYIEIAEIIAHRNARANMIRNEQDAPPRLVYDTETSVFLGGAEVRVHYLGRGHTNGDSIVHYPDLGVIHGGDLLHTTAPFIDYGNGGSSRGWVGAMNGALALDWHTAIPGHGMLMSRRDVVEFRNQMELVRARMAMLIRDGLERDDAIDAIRDPSLSWTQAEQGLFMQRSIPGFYDEIAAEL